MYITRPVSSHACHQSCPAMSTTILTHQTPGHTHEGATSQCLHLKGSAWQAKASSPRIAGDQLIHPVGQPGQVALLQAQRDLEPGTRSKQLLLDGRKPYQLLGHALHLAKLGDGVLRRSISRRGHTVSYAAPHRQKLAAGLGGNSTSPITIDSSSRTAKKHLQFCILHPSEHEQDAYATGPRDLG
jgi:hypothetical protein